MRKISWIHGVIKGKHRNSYKSKSSHNKILAFLTIIILSISVISCSKKDDVTSVKVKITSNTPGVPIKVFSSLRNYFIIKDTWEDTFVPKSKGFYFNAQCEDGSVLITIEIYVNGKLNSKDYGNKSVHASADF